MNGEADTSGRTLQIAIPGRPRLSILLRLLAMFVLGGALGLAILLGGDRMLREASLRLEHVIADQVRALAAIHRLQRQANELRMLEVELPQMRDFFAMSQHLERIENAADSFAQELTPFLAQIDGLRRAEGSRLAGDWRDYREDLDDLIALARRMDLRAAAELSSMRSRHPHAAISLILHEFAGETERAAEEAFRNAQTEQARQKSFFVLVSLAAFVILAGVLILFGRSLALRLHTLRHAASALAAGAHGGAINVSGEDEIAELASAFNAMQEKVVAREQLLRTAHEDLEDRVKARTQDLAAANARLRLLSEAIEQSPIGVLIADKDRHVVYVNHAYVTVTGHTADRVVSGPMPIIHSDTESEQPDIGYVSAIRSGKRWEEERRSRRPDGSEYWEHLRLVPVIGQRGVLTNLLLMREDISARREQEQKLVYQAYYDALTGLPNRTLALDRLQLEANHAHREQCKCVAMFIDLDNFKQINDTLGHAFGDTLLREAADRLRAVVRNEDTVARLGGDEFLVILGALNDVRDAEGVARKIIEAFGPLFRIDEREFSASASIGMSVFPDDGTDPAVLLRNADMAMYEAKAAGRNTYRFFNQRIHDESLERLEMERMLRGALQRNELSLHFQPLVAASDGSLVGAEALLRWDHPGLGRVPPERFIPVAEHSGLIVEIGAWVLEQACAQARSWREANGGQFVIAVNVSPRQFSGAQLVQVVRRCIERFAIPPQQLEIEVTEGLLIRNATEVRDVLEALKTLGVAVSLDDFGTGYASINYLRSLPFHTVKIDRSFIRDLPDEASDRALVVAAIGMAQALGLRVIAEGVETCVQRDFLATHKAHVLQGYLFGRPMSANDFSCEWFGESLTSQSLASP